MFRYPVNLALFPSFCQFKRGIIISLYHYHRSISLDISWLIFIDASLPKLTCYIISIHVGIHGGTRMLMWTPLFCEIAQSRVLRRCLPGSCCIWMTPCSAPSVPAPPLPGCYPPTDYATLFFTWMCTLSLASWLGCTIQWHGLSSNTSLEAPWRLASECRLTSGILFKDGLTLR